jgi:hypothetical protein
MIPSFLNSASLPLAQPFTNNTEHAFCRVKRRSIKTTWYEALDALFDSPCLADSQLRWQFDKMAPPDD